ncbi:MAG: hypothetical protein ACOZAO_01000 [Patescibacteria group bacterium]
MLVTKIVVQIVLVIAAVLAYKGRLFLERRLWAEGSRSTGGGDWGEHPAKKASFNIARRILIFVPFLVAMISVGMWSHPYLTEESELKWELAYYNGHGLDLTAQKVEGDPYLLYETFGGLVENKYDTFSTFQDLYLSQSNVIIYDNPFEVGTPTFGPKDAREIDANIKMYGKANWKRIGLLIWWIENKAVVKLVRVDTTQHEGNQWPTEIVNTTLKETVVENINRGDSFVVTVSLPDGRDQDILFHMGELPDLHLYTPAYSLTTPTYTGNDR